MSDTAGRRVLGRAPLPRVAATALAALATCLALAAPAGASLLRGAAGGSFPGALDGVSCPGKADCWAVASLADEPRHGYAIIQDVARALAGLAILTGFIAHPGGAGPRLFLALTLAGFAVAAAAAIGPGLALRRPRGPAVRLAALACAAATGTMLLASVASLIAGTGLSLWSRGFAGYHQAGPIAVYLALVIAAGAVATVSAGRGARAALAGR